MALEERLELDISEALRGVDTIEGALTASADAFKVALAEALDLLGNVAIEEVDASSVTTGITDAVAAADLEPQIEADASGVTSSIDEAVAAADLAPVVDADASGVTTALDEAVAAAGNEISVTADTSAIPGSIADALNEADTELAVQVITDGITDAIEAAVAAADAEVSVDADVSEAEAALSGLGEAGGAAEEGITGSADAMGVLQGTSQLAAGDLAGVSATLGAVSARGSIVTTAALAVASAIGSAANAAVEGETAQRRYNEALGDYADQISAVGIGGFAEDLESLSERTGNSDEAMKLAAARIFELGRSAEVAGPQVAATTEQILLLATRASVVNPTLGDAGAAAERLTAGLARGGRTLLDFGIALTPAQIQTRALADNVGKSAEELTTYELAAAGAALATEQLGTRITEDIVSGADQPVIALRRIREEFGNALEVIGAPLLEPLIQAAEEGQPILLELATTFGDLGRVALPLVIQALRVAAPIISSVGDVVRVALAALEPLLAVIDGIPDPVLVAVASFLALQGAIGALLALLGTVAPAVAAALGPVGLVLAAVGAGAAAFGAFRSQQDATRQSVDSLSEAFRDQAKSIDEDIDALVRQRTEANNQTDDLRRVGLSVREFAELSSSGTEGLVTFLDRLESTGEITSGVADQLRDAADSPKAFAGALGALSLGAKDAEGSNIGLIESFAAAGREAQEAARATLDKLVVDEKITDSAAKAAVATGTAADGTVNYVAALRSLEVPTGAAVESQGELADAFGDTTEQAAEQERALADLTRAMDAAFQAGQDLVGSQLSVAEAIDALRDSSVEAEGKERALAEAIRLHGRNSAEARNAAEELQDSRRGQLGDIDQLVQANRDLAVQQATAAGQTVTDADKYRIYRDELIKVKDTIAPGSPLRSHLEQLINALPPPQVKAEIVIDTTRAEAAIARLRAQFAAPFGGAPLGGQRFTGPAAAAGGTFGAGRLLVGELGRELLDIRPGTVATVTPNRQTESILAGSGTVALDPAVQAAILDLASQPRIAASIVAQSGGTSTAYETAMETARQLDALAVRHGAGR